MAVSPRRLFLYWVLDADLETALRRAPGPAEIRLQVSRDGRGFEDAARHPFDFRAPSWYLPSDLADCLVRARLGIRAGGGFRDLLVSNAARVPRDRPGDDPETWKTLAALRAGAAAGRPPRFRPAPPLPAGAPGPPRATSPAGGPGYGPGATGSGAAGPGAGGTDAAPGDVCFVLHGHLPFVRHPERDYFLEENWLFEAITETYLPILDMLDHLAADGVPVAITCSLSPTLAAMLRDGRLIDKYARHLDKTCDLARRELGRTRSDAEFGPVAGFYHDRLDYYRWLFGGRYGRDLVAQFARHQEEGRLEVIACAATHAFLPNLAIQPENVRAQIETGVREHARHLGRPPRGLWLPECGWFEGIDDILAGAGIEYVFVDAHAVRHASSRPRLGTAAPIFAPAGVAAFGRDEECSVEVWSAREGYPGDPWYRDFYRDIGYDLDYAYVGPYLDPAGARGFTGLKYHRITGAGEPKEPYRRDRALLAAARHAADFVGKRAVQVARLAPGMSRRPLLVAMYDAELFGHWWFEGPEWIEGVLRRLPERGMRTLTPGAYLDGNPAGQVADPAPSSWGEGGYSEVWVTGANDWILPPLHDAGRRMAGLAAAHPGPAPPMARLLAQAGRELLLAQASDWPFILKNRTAVDYARARASIHLERFDLLARQAEEGRLDEPFVADLEARDNLFPDLDPGLWRPA
jgi:1,4-alpha-glucan branching enzyme